jgi:shikimate dehydrogenase
VTALPGRLALLGHPVRHSLSPAFQNAALRIAGVPLVYEVWDVLPESLGRALEELRAVSGAGNVTLPHKFEVARACEDLTAVARRVGAVNTFWSRDGRLFGDNTDVAGVTELLHAVGANVASVRHVAVLGAGGGAAAVLTALDELGARNVRLWSRTPARAKALCERFAPLATAAGTRETAVRDAPIVINATPVGLRENAIPVPFEDLAPGSLVVDLVYCRGETAWVRGARERGHTAIDGLPMLLAQGALSFERWLGFPPDRDAMRHALEDA